MNIFSSRKLFTCRTFTLVLGSFGMMPASGKLRDAEIIKRRFSLLWQFCLRQRRHVCKHCLMNPSPICKVLHDCHRLSQYQAVNLKAWNLHKTMSLLFWLRIKVNMVSMIINHSMIIIKQECSSPPAPWG